MLEDRAVWGDSYSILKRSALRFASPIEAKVRRRALLLDPFEFETGHSEGGDAALQQQRCFHLHCCMQHRANRWCVDTPGHLQATKQATWLMTVRPQLVELKNGETFNGHLIACDNFMNLTLKEAYETSAVRRFQASAVVGIDQPVGLKRRTSSCRTENASGRWRSAMYEATWSVPVVL